MKFNIHHFKQKIKTFCHSYPFWMPVCRLMQKLMHLRYQLFSRISSKPLPYESAQGWVKHMTHARSHFFLLEDECDAPEKSNHSHQVFAFYLPQFHAFSENDDWWGKGFTEWTNVTKANPQFIGHEQPRLPADLGFYDLSHSEVMYKQAELARKVGIDAFCVYFYWFAGKTLMERPLENWLKQSDLDFPMFFCWANENWTRRWDGQDQEVLIAQDHSPEDDIRFIEHISRYMLDPRYYRIDNKPVLVLYYPSLLPEAKATGNRWRDYMWSNYQTDLHLLVVQSRDQVDPTSIGFDGAIEFPPVGVESRPCTQPLQKTYKEFSHKVFDYHQTVEQILLNDRKENYYRARGVMPGWDNTARRGHDGNVFIHNSPLQYSRWLHDAIVDMRWTQTPDNQMVFINAWNEWAEGAYLEPDRFNGHAYLCATQKAINHWDQKTKTLLQKGHQSNSHAIIIHAYYPEILPILAKRIKASELELDIWVTISNETALGDIRSLWPDARVYLTPNIGRDVAPFLSVLPDIIGCNYQAVLKLHTKKSLHREDGNEWRDFLYSELLPDEPAQALELLNRFCEQEKIGMVAAKGHAPAIKHFWGKNQKWLKRLSQKFSYPEVTGKEIFAAGTMFWFKPEGLQVLKDSPIELGDFYYDTANDIDGTLAHALERYFGVIIAQQNLELIDTEYLLKGDSKYNANHWSEFLGRADSCSKTERKNASNE